MKLPASLAPLPENLGAARDACLPKGTKLGAPSAATSGAAPAGLFVMGAAVLDLASAVSQLPASPPVARLFVHPEAAREDGMLARLRPRRQLSRALRASALLARGYADIGAAEVEGLDWVWGTPTPGA